MIQSDLFYCLNSVTYPPFKHGLYLEEHFLKTISEQKPLLKRTYIPAYWTNFQIEPWFPSKKEEMQQILNDWVRQNPSENGYFTVVQYDDGPCLSLPENTVVYGACSGDIPIPLIYENAGDSLTKIPKKSFSEKEILCSFVGNITANHVQPNVREVMKNTLISNPLFVFFDSGGWTPSVNENLQNQFVNITKNSKFALAPRGYGRSSFRFFECFQLGTIPIYLWNDIEWLPFKHVIDYSKLCISLHISRIGELENIITSVTEEKYNEMLNYYKEIKYLFDLEGMTQEIIKEINN
jgi:hypothetical protein